MLSPLPRRSGWVPRLLTSPAVSAFPDMAVGSARASTFSRLARRSLALRPAHSRCHQVVARFTEGFNRFVTSTVAPVASGWSSCRVGLSPTGKRRLCTAHANSGHSSRTLNFLHSNGMDPSSHLTASSARLELCVSSRGMRRSRHEAYSRGCGFGEAGLSGTRRGSCRAADLPPLAQIHRVSWSLIISLKDFHFTVPGHGIRAG